jgi:hypothetical protein
MAMSDSFGLGDGVNDLSGTSGLADARATDARRAGGHPIATGRWPSTGTFLRAVALIVVAAVVAGWALTVLSGS